APVEKKYKKAKPVPAGPEYLLVDGYNIIFAWDETKELAKQSLQSARDRLIDILCNYQGFSQCELILVFDAYKVKGNTGSVEKVHNINVVYTKEAETADMYIEKTTHELGKKHRVRVATSDSLEQIIILGNGAVRVSAGELWKEIQDAEKAIKEILKNSV
ncbi:MAG: NYN domain-containing protein, partial [Clostridia bacterium]|nr:NYN domain-containing protein [Clostridia bacterium]